MGYPLEFRNNVARSILSDGTRISDAAKEYQVERVCEFIRSARAGRRRRQNRKASGRRRKYGASKNVFSRDSPSGFFFPASVDL